MKDLKRLILDVFDVPQPMSLPEWSETFRVLSPKTSAYPGKWSNAMTPYLTEIMRCLSVESTVERVILKKSAQVGGTEVGLNWIGYIIHQSPAPIMIVWPTVELAKRNSKHRLDALFDVPVLKSRIAPPRSRNASNTVFVKEFHNGILVITGANSAVGLRSMPVRFLFLDEVDGYPPDVDGEGSAIALAEERTVTFPNRKIFIVSTPTLAGYSLIESEYERTDQRKFFVPCPFCGGYQVLKFDGFVWEAGYPHTVKYKCELCGELIGEEHKRDMVAKGEWRATNVSSNPKVVGFHIWAAYSPWKSWSEIIRQYEEASDPENGSVFLMKTFYNTVLGEAWQDECDAPEHAKIMSRAEDYTRGIVPEGGLILTAGVDVQKVRIECSVYAWGVGKECWLVDHQIFFGDIAESAVWESLYSYLTKPFQLANGVDIRVSKVAIDTGYNPAYVYDFLRSKRDSRLVGVKGTNKGSLLVGSPIGIGIRKGKKVLKDLWVFPVNTSLVKQELYANLRKESVVDLSTNERYYPPGYIHFPKMDEEFFQQICAEQLVLKRRRDGFHSQEWRKIRERNEALDCYVYARAAAYLLGIDRFTDKNWRDIKNRLSPVSVVATQSDEKEEYKPRKYRSKWLSSVNFT